MNTAQPKTQATSLRHFWLVLGLTFAIPSAYAAENQGQTIYAISHMAAVVAKQYHCGEKSITDSEMQYCVLVAAAMNKDVEKRIKYSEKKLYWPVRYLCPKTKTAGELQLTAMDNAEHTMFIEISYVDSYISGIYLYFREGNTKEYDFGLDFNANTAIQRGVKRDADEEDIAYGTEMAKMTDLVNIAVCNEGKDARSRYDKVLEENKASLVGS